jgi:hypothetical protein
MKKQMRRSFLQSANAGVIAATLPQPSIAANPVSGAAKAAAPLNPQGLVDLVHMLQGTESTPVFSRGNTLPIVTVPSAWRTGRSKPPAETAHGF